MEFDKDGLSRDPVFNNEVTEVEGHILQGD